MAGTDKFDTDDTAITSLIQTMHDDAVLQLRQFRSSGWIRFRRLWLWTRLLGEVPRPIAPWAQSNAFWLLRLRRFPH